jgi:hypothetical protein
LEEDVPAAGSRTLTRAALEPFADMLRKALPKLAAEPIENMMLFWCRDGQVGAVTLDVGDERSCELSPAAVKRALSVNGCETAESVFVLAHNHPSGFALPSRADLQATYAVRAALSESDPDFLDHLVVAKAEPGTAVSIRHGVKLMIETFQAADEAGQPALQATLSPITLISADEERHCAGERAQGLAEVNCLLKEWYVEWNGDCCAWHASLVVIARKDGAVRAEFRGIALNSLRHAIEATNVAPVTDAQCAGYVGAFKRAQEMGFPAVHGFRLFEVNEGLPIPAPGTLN